MKIRQRVAILLIVTFLISCSKTDRLIEQVTGKGCAYAFTLSDGCYRCIESYFGATCPGILLGDRKEGSPSCRMSAAACLGLLGQNDSKVIEALEQGKSAYDSYIYDGDGDECNYGGCFDVVINNLKRKLGLGPANFDRCYCMFIG